ncbi:hypothetical protein CAPTEDRAFT_217675, partial [Capitella teleta]|uniref:Uncharacterized protein n=1 Tax=Capitella teleta TaxID=283909 RepID=X2AMI8_CAPTE
MECPFPHHLRGVAAEHAAFPQEDDKKLLMELIRGRKASPSHMDAQRVQVRKVRTKKYADSDSSSGSERSSPLLSSRNESMFTHTDSLRSSTISSEGRITMVTDTISDLDYPLSESCQPSPRSMRALSPDNRSPSLSHREMNGGRSRSPSPSTRSQGDPSPVTSDAGGLEEEGSAGDGDSSSDSHVTLVAVEDETKDLQSCKNPFRLTDSEHQSDVPLTKYTNPHLSMSTLGANRNEMHSIENNVAPTLPSFLTHPEHCIQHPTSATDPHLAGAVDRSVNNQSPWEHLEQDAAHLMVPPEESNDGSYKEESKEGCTEKEEEEDLLLAYRKAAIPLQMMINEIENDDDEDSLSVISERTEPDDNFEIVDLNYVSCEQDAKPDEDVVANEQLSIQSAAEIPFEVVPPVGEIQVEKSVEESSTIPSENPENKKQEEKKEQTEEMTEETRERTISEISLDSANMKRRDTLGTLASSQDSLNMPTSDLDDDLDVILEQNKDFVSEAELQDIMREIAERNETANGSMSKQVIEELKLHLQNRAAAAAATAAAAVTTEEEKSIEDEDEETEDGAVDDTPISPINDLQKMFDKPPKYFGSATQPIPIAKHLDSVEYQPDEKKTPEEEVHVQKEVTVTNFDEGPVLTSTVTESVCMQVMQNVEEAEPEVDQAVLLPLKDERVKAGNEDAATDDALQDEAEKSSPDEETEEVVTDDVVQDKTNESEPGEETVESVEEKERESLTNEVHAVIVTAEEVEREKVEVVIESESPEPTSSSPVTPPAGFKDSLNSISASEQEKKENEEEERGEQPMEETLGSVKTCSFETLYQAEATAEEEAQDEGILATHSGRRVRVAGSTIHWDSEAQPGWVQKDKERHRQNVGDVFRLLRSLSRESRWSSSSDLDAASFSDFDDVDFDDDSMNVLVEANSEKPKNVDEAFSLTLSAPTPQVLMPNAPPDHCTMQSVLRKIHSWDTTDDPSNGRTPPPSPASSSRQRKHSSPTRQPRLGTSSLLLDPGDRSPPPVIIQTKVITSVESARRLSTLDPLSTEVVQDAVVQEKSLLISSSAPNPIRNQGVRWYPPCTPHPALDHSFCMLIVPVSKALIVFAAHLEANGFLAPPSPARSRADTEDATDSKSVEKEPIRSAESPVPSIAVTCPEKSSLHSEKDDNIDEAFAEQTPENASNLLSPHSTLQRLRRFSA